MCTIEILLDISMNEQLPGSGNAIFTLELGVCCGWLKKINPCILRRVTDAPLSVFKKKKKKTILACHIESFTGASGA